MIIDFDKEFLTKDFDSILLEHNNPLCNSEDYYLKYKTKYINETLKSKKRYNEIVSEIKVVNNIHVRQNKAGTKMHYMFVDETRVLNLKQELKILINEQQTRFKHFLHYLNQLNEDYKRILYEESKSKSPSIKSIKSVNSIKSSYSHDKPKSKRYTNMKKK